MLSCGATILRVFSFACAIILLSKEPAFNFLEYCTVLTLGFILIVNIYRGYPTFVNSQMVLNSSLGWIIVNPACSKI